MKRKNFPFRVQLRRESALRRLQESLKLKDYQRKGMSKEQIATKKEYIEKQIAILEPRVKVQL